MSKKYTLPEIHAALREQKFEDFQDWVNTATRKLAYYERDANLRSVATTPPDLERAICFDTKGRRCLIGKDFSRARDEDAFPVRYIWPDQMISLAMLVPLMSQLAQLEE